MFTVLSKKKKVVRLWIGKHVWTFSLLQEANDSQTTHDVQISHGYSAKLAS